MNMIELCSWLIVCIVAYLIIEYYMGGNGWA